jgi:hypothetical protein
MSPGGSTSETILDALSDIETMLKADGYSLDVSVDQSGIDLTVSAAEGCGECLVPKAVMQPMIADALSRQGIDGSFTLRYPESHADA